MATPKKGYYHKALKARREIKRFHKERRSETPPFYPFVSLRLVGLFFEGPNNVYHPPSINQAVYSSAKRAV